MSGHERSAPDGDRTSGLLADVAVYYSRRLAEFGQTPKGVDWNGADSQRLRFAQLARLLPQAERFSVVDLGCGYGAFIDYLTERGDLFDYLGLDVSEQMVNSARRRYDGSSGVRFAVGAEPPSVVDYCVASGIFGVKQHRSDDEWLDYLHATLDAMNEHSIRGFAFNCLTKYSDPDRMRADLYYADPLALFDRCKLRYARQVALLHDYGLFEFTILVRKDRDDGNVRG